MPCRFKLRPSVLNPIPTATGGGLVTVILTIEESTVLLPLKTSRANTVEAPALALLQA